MKHNIFNNHIGLSLFCQEIVESWIKHRKFWDKPINEEEFMEWVNKLFIPLLEDNIHIAITEMKK